MAFTGRIWPAIAADIINDTASTISVNGKAMAAISAPPIACPAMSVAALLTLLAFPLADTRSDRHDIYDHRRGRTRTDRLRQLT